MGISTTDPATGVVTIDEVVITPKINNMVVFGTKEYIYRNGDKGESWYEMGDEEAPGWQDDDDENSWSVSEDD